MKFKDFVKTAETKNKKAAKKILDPNRFGAVADTRGHSEHSYKIYVPSTDPGTPVDTSHHGAHSKKKKKK